MPKDSKELHNEFVSIRKALQENLEKYTYILRSYHSEKDLDKKRNLRKEAGAIWDDRKRLDARRIEICQGTANERETSSEKRVVEAKIPWNKKREEFQKIHEAKKSKTNEKDKDRDKDDLEIER